MVESMDDLNYRESRSKRIRRFYANINFNEGDARDLARFDLTYLFSMGIEFWRGFRGETISFLHWDIVDPICPIDRGESTSLFIPRRACGPFVFKFIQTNLVRTRDATEFASVISQFIKLNSNGDSGFHARFMDEFNARFELETAIKGIDCGNASRGESSVKPHN